MRALIIAALLVQPGPRAPLSPAETLLEPEILRTIERSTVEGPAVTVIPGSADASAGEIAVICQPTQCEAVEWAMRKLGPNVAGKIIPRPARTIRMVSATQPPSGNIKSAIFVAESQGSVLQVVRGPWSTADVTDEVIDVFARHAVRTVDARSFENAGQPRWSSFGIPITAIVPPADASGLDRSAFIIAASAYFLARLPYDGAEALLSHLTVGAHARLAEDGRRAVAQMGNQQRAGADVLIMFGQAIEREQRRMRSFERYMPTPVDPMLRSRIGDMEKGITSVWTSIGITSSPFVPAAERLRGRGGEDRRIVTRTGSGLLPKPDLPTAFLKFPNVDDVIDELGNFIDGTRSISDIRDAVSAEFGPIALPVVVEYFERLAKAGAIALR